MSRILVIEDNPANLDLMTYLLRARGHDALTAPDGEQGLARARSEPPDLVVCDIQLPGIDGYAVAQAMKADPALRAIPLIAVTALAMLGDRDRVLAGGYDAYISKPIDPERFVTLLETWLPTAATHQTVPADGEAALAQPMAQPKRAGGTILVVDDSHVNLSFERSLLEPMGYRVLTASSMAQALEAAKDARPDLIVSDVAMPDGDGFALIARIKSDADLAAIPFMFLTSTFCNPADRRRGLALGAVRYLFRPLEPEALLAEVQDCLEPRPD
jgi:two-component system cell cycle response regulator